MISFSEGFTLLKGAVGALASGVRASRYIPTTWCTQAPDHPGDGSIHGAQCTVTKKKNKKYYVKYYLCIKETHFEDYFQCLHSI